MEGLDEASIFIISGKAKSESCCVTNTSVAVRGEGMSQSIVVGWGGLPGTA